MCNSQLRAAILWFSLSLAGILAVTLGKEYFPTLDQRGAVTFLGIFLSVGGAVVGLMFIRRAWILADMLKGADVVASFSYPGHLLQRLAEGVREERLKDNTMRFIFISVIVLFVTLFVVVLIIADGSSAAIIPLLLVITMLEVLMFVFSKLSPHAAYRRVIKSDGQVIIAPKGLFFCGELHVWHAFMSKLTLVFVTEKKKGTFLCFRYSYYVSYLPPIKNCFEVALPLFDLDNREVTQKVLTYFKQNQTQEGVNV